VVAATVAALALGLGYPLGARGNEFYVCVRNLAVGVPRSLFPDLFPGADVLHLSWQKPLFLLGLVLVPFVFWRGTFGQDARVPRLRLGTVAPLVSGPRGVRVWLRDVPGVLRAVALALLVMALAGPQNTLTPQTTDEEGVDLVVALDLSESMKAVLENVPPELEPWMPTRARGMRPTRMDVAKAVLRDFVSRRKSDRIGIVVFGREAFVLSPPTLDYPLLDLLVSRTEIGMVDGSHTAIGEGVGVAAARLRRSTAKSKGIVLLTDGDNNAGKISPEYAADLVNAVGARLYTIQIGEGDAALVQDGFDLFGQPRYVRVAGISTNPELLEKLAKKTNGAAYVASDASRLRESVHQVLDSLEKTRFAATFASYEALFRFLLLPGALLLALEALLRSLILRRFP
jgi:Ca-activated chloride channel family protein